MKIVTFNEVDPSFIDDKHTVEHFHSGCTGDAEVVIMDIDTIFDFEENKGTVCADKYISVAVIDDDGDYEAFKNFGIDAWVKAEDLKDLNSLLNLIEKRSLS